MNGNQWRNASPADCPSCGRQWPQERLELVERVIRAEKAARIAEAKARALLEDDAISAVVAERDDLRVTVARLNARIAHLNRRTA